MCKACLCKAVKSFTRSGKGGRWFYVSMVFWIIVLFIQAFLSVGYFVLIPRSRLVYTPRLGDFPLIKVIFSNWAFPRPISSANYEMRLTYMSLTWWFHWISRATIPRHRVATVTRITMRVQVLPHLQGDSITNQRTQDQHTKTILHLVSIIIILAALFPT